MFFNVPVVVSFGAVVVVDSSSACGTRRSISVAGNVSEFGTNDGMIYIYIYIRIAKLAQCVFLSSITFILNCCS